MTSLWNGSGGIVRTDGTRTGPDVWAQALAADVDVNAADADTHDEGLADSIERCLNLDGENSPAADIDWDSNKITNLASGTARGHAVNVGQISDGGITYAGTSGGTANAQTLTITPGITAYVAGMAFRFIAGATNTSATVTLNVGGVGATAVLNKLGNPPPIGSIVSGRSYVATYDGTNWIIDAADMTLQASVATTSGTTVDITGIPAGARRITLFLDGVGGDGTDDLWMRIGDSGDIETTGYFGGGGKVTGSNTCNVTGALSGAAIELGTSVANEAFYGVVTLTRSSTATHRWAVNFQVSLVNASVDASDARFGTVFKTLSAELDRVQLLWSGTDDFDAGSVSILIE